MAQTDDPEVQELLAATRRLTGQAFRLSTEIGQTVDELESFIGSVNDLDSRMTKNPKYQGLERRRDR